MLSSQASTSDPLHPNSDSSLCSCSRVPRPKRRKLKGGVHRCMAGVVRGCRSVKTNDPRPHTSRRLYARRAAILRTSPRPPKPKQPPKKLLPHQMSPPIEPQRNIRPAPNLEASEASVCCSALQTFCSPPPPSADHPI
jgi:hypothetical protein